jgi:hypothetical protein
MGTQDYRATYRVAMQVATSELNDIYQEFEHLQIRKEQIEDVLTALQPFLPFNSAVQHQELQTNSVFSEPARIETRYEVLTPELVAPVSEPNAPPAFAPVPEIIVDPIQNRINRALGLAVA